METEQFNFRISKSLVYDLEFIAKVLKVSKTEWVKIKLAEIIAKEKEDLLGKIEKSYINERIDERRFKELTGVNVPKQLEIRRTNELDRKKRDIEIGKKGKNGLMKEIVNHLTPEDRKEILKFWKEEE